MLGLTPEEIEAILHDAFRRSREYTQENRSGLPDEPAALATYIVTHVLTLAMVTLITENNRRIAEQLKAKGIDLD